MKTKDLFIKAYGQFKYNDRFTLDVYSRVIHDLNELDKLKKDYKLLDEKREMYYMERMIKIL